MPLHHCDVEDRINSRLWLDAENDLVEAVARALCSRHGAEIWGPDKVTRDFLDSKWRCFECEARDAVAIIRQYEYDKEDRQYDRRAPVEAPSGQHRGHGEERQPPSDPVPS